MITKRTEMSIGMVASLQRSIQNQGLTERVSIRKIGINGGVTEMVELSGEEKLVNRIGRKYSYGDWANEFPK